MWRDKLVTAESQLRMLDEILAIYRRKRIPCEWEIRTIPIHTLTATQNGVEADKFEAVLQMVKEGGLGTPVIVEEHFVDDQYRRYLIDGHCRTKARIELGERTTEAYVIWSPRGDFASNFVTVAAQYGNVLVKDLPLIPPNGG